MPDAFTDILFEVDNMDDCPGLRDGTYAQAGAHYALHGAISITGRAGGQSSLPDGFPEPEGSARDKLVMAAAYIIHEIDKIDRQGE